MIRIRPSLLILCLSALPLSAISVPIEAIAVAQPNPMPSSTIDLWEWDTDHIAKQLPIWETPEERRWNVGPPPILVNDPPPLQPIRNVGEFEPMSEVLIRYPLGIPYALISEMARNVTVACVVSSSYLNTARSNFQANGINPDAIDWIVCPSDSYWTRDYGPWFVFDGNGALAIVDFHYNRSSRPNDDQVPIYCGQHWGIPVYQQDLTTTGGNYMTDGYGISFSTDLVWDENAGMTHDQIFQRMHDYYGLNAYNVLPDHFVSYIRHIDCWGKSLDEETVLVKQVDPSHPDYAGLEQNATVIASLQDPYGRNYRVVRVYCQSVPGDDVAGYTNSLILNRKVLVPTWNNAQYDTLALQAYRRAMPGYKVIGVANNTGNGWVSSDALHCRAIGIADRGMLRVATTPIVEWHVPGPIAVNAFIDDRSGTGLKADSLLVYWRAYVSGNPAPPFHALVMQPTGVEKTYAVTIPTQPTGETVDYYIQAADNSGRHEGMPRGEPAGWYSFNVTYNPADVANLGARGTRAELGAVSPNPFREATTFSFALKYTDHVSLAVFDVQGRLVRTLIDGAVGPGKHDAHWDAKDGSGRDLVSGTYFFSLRVAGVAYSRKVVVEK